METIIDNVLELSVDLLLHYPRPVLERIWNVVCGHDLNGLPLLTPVLCFNLWRIFCVVLGTQTEMPLSLLRYNFHLEKPASPLCVYAKPLTSPGFDFITQ